MKRITALALAALTVISLLSFSACKKEEAGNGETVNVEISVKGFGIMKLELYPDIAPITVENFTTLARDGFYDGLTFHRIVKGFMIQGGDPQGTGMGGSSKTIKGEFSENGVSNIISHKRGVISMARNSVSMDSASSQFFICHADASASLDGKYAAFGMVTEGLDVLDEIANVECTVSSNGEKSAPVEKPVIEYIKVVE